MKILIEHDEIFSPSFAELLMLLGYEGYGISVAIRGLMMKCSGRIQRDDAAIAFLCRVREPKIITEIIECLCRSKVFAVSDGMLSCIDLERQGQTYKRRVAILSGNNDDKMPGAIPYPDEESKVRLTPAQVTGLLSRFTEDNVKLLVRDANRWADVNPKKFNQRTNHFQMLLRFHDKKVQDGYQFFAHPNEGPGYYRSWIVEKFQPQQ